MSGPLDHPELILPVGSRDHVQGPASAPITLLEYGDYECPYCGEAYPIVKDIQRKMGSELRFVFRNLPISNSHPHARQAAEAAEGAGAHGRFWEMHDTLYEHQRALTEDDLVGYAEGLGLDGKTFRRELDTHAYARRVDEDFMSGVRSGANGTPTFFVNGVRHNGSYAESELLRALHSAAPRARRG